MATDTAHRFAFGNNWEKFSETVSEQEISEAVENLARLLPGGRLDGKRFLDIGCGSGLHALAAIKLGAKSVTAFDIDKKCVETTTRVLSTYAPTYPATVLETSILDNNPPAAVRSSTYDLVYSWGVLHHTGDMWGAIRNAVSFVAPDGSFIIAIYKKTPLCGFWKSEKAVYSRLPNFLQTVFAALFSCLFLLGVLAQGKNPVKYVKTYKGYRGMNFWHDMIDWLGGYPYQSASPQEIRDFCASLGLRLVAEYNVAAVKAAGLFGSGCAEYVFVRG